MIVLIKTKNGAEIVGSLISNTSDGVMLGDPFLINYRFAVGQPMPSISLSRYMPFAGDCERSFDWNDIMHYTSPSQPFEAYYINALEYCKEVVDKSVNEELMSAAVKTKNGKSDLTDIYKAILDRTNYDGPLN
jgi:hypothetical protein